MKNDESFDWDRVKRRHYGHNRNTLHWINVFFSENYIECILPVYILYIFKHRTCSFQKNIRVWSNVMWRCSLFNKLKNLFRWPFFKRRNYLVFYIQFNSVQLINLIFPVQYDERQKKYTRWNLSWVWSMASWQFASHWKKTESYNFIQISTVKWFITDARTVRWR